MYDFISKETIEKLVLKISGKDSLPEDKSISVSFICCCPVAIKTTLIL